MFQRDALPGAITFLFPGVKGLAVELMDGRFGDLHRRRITGEKEINVIHVTADVRQVDAGEIAARTQFRQVFGVDSDQLKTEFLVAIGKLEISSAPADLRLDVPLDAGLDRGGWHRVDHGRGRGARRLLPLLLAATR